MLIPKAHGALERYGHQVVIGNDLNRRKFEVVFVSRNSQGSSTPFTESWLKIDLSTHPDKEIEEDIIAALVKRHEEWTAEK